MKIVSIVGARPQFIKCAPVSRELRKEHHEILVHTGQHYDANMSDIFFEQLNIPKPDYNLNIGSGSHGEQTGKMLIEIEKVLIKEKPDMVLVYGDTNSTLAGALAAAKLHIPVAHVEAGLRSFDRTMPEEINRVMTDHISDLLFCPTQTAVDNLLKEGISQENGKGVYLTGDVMVDALLYNMKIAEQSSTVLEDLNQDLVKGEYYVATVHRPSNTDTEENLRNIVEAFGEIGLPIIFPAHPRTVKYLKEYGLYDHLPKNIHLTEPLPYLDMLHLMRHAKMILTDSGGVQKEAYILPGSVISGSMGQAYLGEASKMIREKSTELRSLYVRTLKHLSMIAIPLIGIPALCAPFVFPIIFGEAWSEAGWYCWPLAFMVISGFIVSPTSFLHIYGHNQWQLIWDITRVVIVIVGFYTSWILGFSILITLLVYSGIMFLMYILNAILVLKAISSVMKNNSI